MKERYTDEFIEKMGKYFVKYKVLETWGMSFEKFLHINYIGNWRYFV